MWYSWWILAGLAQWNRSWKGLPIGCVCLINNVSFSAIHKNKATTQV